MPSNVTSPLPLGLYVQFYNWLAPGLNNQTLFGSTLPSQANIQRQLRLATNNGTDVKSRLDGYGGGNNSFQNFTCSVMVQLPSASVNSNIGIVYKTTCWANANHPYAYKATSSPAPDT